MTTGPQDPAAAGRDRLRAAHADREQVIDTLKTAFVDGRLTKDELGARTGQALSARTYADLAALTADIPAGPAAARTARPPGPARSSRPLAKATAGSGSCLAIAFGAVWLADTILDPDGPGPHPYHSWARLCFFVAVAAVVTALCILVHGVGASVEQRRSRGQLLPRPRPGGGQGREGGRRGGVGHDSVRPAPRTDQTGAEMRARKPRRHRRHGPDRAGRAPRRTGLAPEAV